jgi:REP element-mobilizing transposase RayT
MARKERLKSSTGIYHILARGISQQRIFEQAEDYEQFLDFLFDIKKKSGFTLYAYTLMGNHIHLLLREGPESISQIFKRLGTRYAQWFNGKYERSGHLFQNRFSSEPIEDDNYFLTALIYIYQNPVKAGICTTAVDYEWSSRRFLGKGVGIVDEMALTGIASIATIKQREHELIEDTLLDKPKVGRRAAYSDKTVIEIIRMICGVLNGPEFMRLSREEQKSVVEKLREERVPIRQIARVTGLSKGVVESWCR